jgi:hypothetical protein
MATITTNTTITLPAGQMLVFGLGGSATAIIDGNVYDIGQGEKFFGPFTQTESVQVVVRAGTITYNIETDGAASREITQDPISRQLTPDSADAVRGAVAVVSSRWNPAAVVELGDSYAENGFAISAAGVAHTTQLRGRSPSLNMVMGAPWRQTFVRCKGGSRTDQWLSGSGMTYGALTQALTDDAYHVLITFPTNDVAQLGGTYQYGAMNGLPITTANIINALQSIVEQLLTAGKLPWLTVGGIAGNYNASKLAAAAEINAWVLANARQRGLPWIDDQTIADPATGMTDSAWAYDEGGSVYIHPNSIGAFTRALRNRARLAPFVAQSLVAEPWRASKVVNGRFLNHTSGIPASWTTYGSNAGTPTRTAPVDANGGWQTSFTAAAANGADGLSQNISLATAGLAVGDVVQAVWRGQIVSATGGVTPRVYVTFTGASGDYTYMRANNRQSPDGNLLWSSNAADNTFAVPTMAVPIPAGTTALAVILAFEADNGAAVVARANGFELYKR